MNQLVKAIDKAVQDREGGKTPRFHLGASQIGGKCARAIWYKFRGAHDVKHTGRLLRLFQRGHEEEFRFVEYLRLIGAEVRDYSKRLMYHDGSDSYVLQDWDDVTSNPELDDVSDSRMHIERATARGQGPKQYGFADGHFSGSCDGIVLNLPGQEGRGLLEFKTHSDKSFKDVSRKGVLTSKPVHYAQMQVYMLALDLPWALYCAVNKNDDELYCEIVHRREEAGQQLVAKAQAIVASSVPPARMSHDPSWHECTYCDFREICHFNKPLDKGCRSCAYMDPRVTGSWYCRFYATDVPTVHLSTDCDYYASVTSA